MANLDPYSTAANPTSTSSSNMVSCPVLKSEIVSAKTTSLQLEASRSLEEKKNEDEGWEMDPHNAHNWSILRKWAAVATVSLYAAVHIFFLAMIAPALPEIAKRFHVHNPTITALILTVSLLSYIFGPLVLVPLSEMYGRVWVLNICTIIGALFNLGCAFSPNVGTLIAFRAFYGFVGSAPSDVAIGVVSDIFPSKHQATPIAMYHVGSVIGQFTGHVVGGYMAQMTSSEWIFIVIAALLAGMTFLGVILLRETYAPVIRMRQAKREHNLEKAARVHPMLLGSQTNLVTLFRINLTRPWVLLFHSFICFMLSVFGGLLYGNFYLMLTGFPELFSRTYGFKPGVIGLAYSGLSFGFTFSMIIGGKWADYLADKNGGKGKPEMRMPSIIPGSILVSIGLLWYGWSAQAKLHWIMPIIGSTIFGFGLMTAALAITLYLTDAFTYAASALAAASVFRSIFGFAFPLFGKQMFDALGQGVASSLLTSFAILFGIPFPIFIYYKGEAIRARSPLTIST